jgi:phage anti-repressor protein
MKAKKNFEKIAILKAQELVSFWGVKTHFGKIPLNCAFSDMKK